MTAQFPGTQRADLQVVRDDKQAADTTAKALGLLENARKVADATVAEARAEAERLLAAARERALQVQRDAKELGEKLRSDAERETAQARHQAYGEAERIVADARSEVSTLKSSVAGLREERDAAESSMRELSERLHVALEAYAAPADEAQAHGEQLHHQ
jgi:V/A-type H+/Na+-transporting ATPase subunit G/H